jgi:hypothetical protein
MKPVSFLMCTVLFLASIVPLHAQASSPATLTFTAKIPFDFMVQRVMFPAGSYVVRQTTKGTLTVKAEQGLESVAVPGAPIERAAGSQMPSLVFSKDTGHFQLREVWMTSRLGRELPGTTQQLRTVSLSRVEVFAHCDRCE